MTREFKRLQMPQASPFSQVDDKIRNVGSWQSAPKVRGQLHGLEPRDKGCLGQLSDPAGRNVSEVWAGLESDNADADPPANWGRPRERGSNRHEHPLDPPG
jgi:hypothetical protein